MRTASRVFSQPTTKPFLKNGPTACVSITMVFMILAVVDDLMFTSKIRTTAAGLGVTVAFARSPEGALAEMRASAPSLVIFDLNSQRADPLGTAAAMKMDEAPASLPPILF